MHYNRWRIIIDIVFNNINNVPAAIKVDQVDTATKSTGKVNINEAVFVGSGYMSFGCAIRNNMGMSWVFVADKHRRVL